MAETFLVSDDTDIDRQSRLFALSDPVAEPSALEEEASAIKTLQPQVTIDKTPTCATEPVLDSDRVTSPPEEVAEKVAEAVIPAVFEEVSESEKVAQAATPAVFEEASEEEVALYNLSRICDLVNELLATYSKISENRQAQVEHLKREYEGSSHNASDKIRQGGYAGAWISGSSIVVFGVGLFLPEAGRKVCEFASGQIPNFGNIWKTSIESGQHLDVSKESLSLNELQTKANQTGQQDNSRVTQLLDAAVSLQKSASAGG